MEADINTAKSKAFNCLLRYLHYSILLFLADRVNSTTLDACSEPGKANVNIFNYFAIALMVLGLISLCYVHNRTKFPRVEFFVSIFISFVLSLVVVIMSFSAMNSAKRECMQGILLQKWSIFSTFRVFLECLLVMVCNLFWGQRYTNCPANLTWAYMFLTISWNSVGSKAILLSIGIAYLAISVITFIIQTGTMITGVTTGYRKLIKFWWIFAIVLMVVFEILGLVGFISSSFTGSFKDVAASRLYQLFLAGNIVDILFWLWGLLTLSYQNGDLIRDNLVDLHQDSPSDAHDYNKNVQQQPPVQYYSSAAPQYEPTRNSSIPQQVAPQGMRFTQQPPGMGGVPQPVSRISVNSMGTIIR